MSQAGDGDRSSRRALELALVNRVVARAQLADATQSLVERLAASPVLALARTKALPNELLNNSLATQLHAEQRAFAVFGADGDFSEALAAFCARHKPAYR